VTTLRVSNTQKQTFRHTRCRDEHLCGERIRENPGVAFHQHGTRQEPCGARQMVGSHDEAIKAIIQTKRGLMGDKEKFKPRIIGF
jgi:hypothetical protein